ncbi:aldo/keto reductase [Microbacterium sp. SORGH_AS_0888]|uniref:aldo/keto reductase n=1 Tax=Microbacterium sp. SORGH_AS_0888 TaxID=3041791 RepID=UPI00277E2924|nr:aldo/keto reductase [Microbacterium sp. SORGH_AS_0888]MDQ1130440.1 2,5-diketo-D-gluconate reductase A [Microbacterium sp. SORGH_AS_0888]
MTGPGPRPGLGTWQLGGSTAVTVVGDALRLGYRTIDTAAAYGNEAEVGRALAASAVDLEQITVITKVWPSDYERVAAAVDESRLRLGLDVIGTVLLHWPVPRDFERTVRAFAALLEARERGRLRSAGVSNFLPEHLARLHEAIGVVPEVNQVELHPYLAGPVRAPRSERLALQAHSPFGGQVPAGGAPVDDPEIREIAAEVGATPAQVVLAWLREHGVTALPKTTSAGRLSENLASTDVVLTAAHMARIDGLDRGARRGPDPREVHDTTFG